MKFTVNFEMVGYEQVDINDNRLLGANNTVIMALTEETNGLLNIYYNRVIDMILSGTKLICVSVGEASKIRKAIMMVMVAYRNYSIYEVDNLEDLDPSYVDTIENREPDLIEVQQYIGGDITAYSDVNTVLFGIKSLVEAGDLDGLKVFIEQHVDSIDSSIEVIEYLKKVTDSFNSGDMASLIDVLKEKLDDALSQVDGLNDEVERYRNETGQLNERLDTLNNDLRKSNRKVAELEAQSSMHSDSGIITTYKEINTSLLKCQTRYVLYFKEISYCQYANSLVLSLLSILTTMFRQRVKLLVYDDRVRLPSIYKGFSILNTKEYLSNKDSIKRNSTKLVVSEPSQVFLDDALTSLDPKTDVIIVYDRLRQTTDLVSGNNVTRFFVVNSASNFNAAKELIRIPANTTIISNDFNIEGAIHIPEIPDYSRITPSAKLTRYTRLPLEPNSNDTIIKTLLKKARINS